MKSLYFLSLVLLSTFTSAFEFVRLPDVERIELDRQFSLETAHLIEEFGSGDIVGNGGGLIEQNFILAYFSVQTAIENCLATALCYKSLHDKRILKELNTLFINKLNQKNTLIFLKNSDTDNFFNGELDASERLAKTGFSKDHPIFINIDEASDIKNNIPAMISILIHELGHQLGITGHNYLGLLSAKVRNNWEESWTESSIEIGERTLTAKLFSTQSNFINAKLSYEFEGSAKNLNSKIFEVLKCNAGETLYGFYLSNQHWNRPVSTRKNYSVNMELWLDIYCQDTYGAIWTNQKDLSVKFDFNKVQGTVTNLEDVSVIIK